MTQSLQAKGLRRFTARFACAFICAAALPSCTIFKAHAVARATTNGLYSIGSYRARTSETGILRDAPGTPVVKTILYERPWKVRAEVVSPPEHAGETFVFDGQTMSIWWPSTRIGLRIRGLSVPGRRAVARMMLDNSYWLLRHYDFSEEDESRVAGREVNHWKCLPASGRPHLLPYDAWLDARNFVPLKLTVEDSPGHEWYGMEFETFELGASVPPGAFKFEFPPDAIVFDCDLAGPDVTLFEAQEQVDFPVLKPALLPRGHALRRVVMGGDPDAAPMVVLLMPNGARWLSLTEMMNTGPAVMPKVGIPVRIGEREGVLNFAFGFTTISWCVDNTSLTLIGNLPYPEMLGIAGTVGEEAPRPVR